MAVVFVAAVLSAQLASREPSPNAPPHTDFTWTSKGGLKFAWRVPRGYGAGAPVHATVICHGTGLDHRWGPANHPPQSFRPQDVVVAVDGPTPAEGSRLFLGESSDVKAFAEFLAELRTLFAVESVFLYGHSQGGFFVAHYAGERPGDVRGVVAHASGAWSHSKTTKASHAVAYSFLHGTRDPVVPFVQSVGARDHYVRAGFPLVKLRRLERYNHWPNAVRASEELDWCQGMTTARADEALACAERILTPKPADEYQWTTAVGFSGAHAILRRVLGEAGAPLGEVDPKLRERAAALADALERAAQRHVDELRPLLAKNKSLALDGGAWLGHLVALREDFRGVAGVEAFVAEVGFEKLLAKQSADARKLATAWYGEAAPDKKYEELIEALAGAYLHEGEPFGLGEQLGKWRKDEKRLGVSKRASKSYEAVEKWDKGWREGLEAYARVWKKWKLP